MRSFSQGIRLVASLMIIELRLVAVQLSKVDGRRAKHTQGSTTYARQGRASWGGGILNGQGLGHQEVQDAYDHQMKCGLSCCGNLWCLTSA